MSFDRLAGEQRVRRFSALCVLLLGVVLAGPESLRGFQTGPQLPSLDSSVESNAAHGLTTVLSRYYGGRGSSLLPDRPRPVCDADRGQRCVTGDPDGGCSASMSRCRSAADRRRLVEGLTKLARDHPTNPVVVAHTIYAQVKFGLFDEARRLLDTCEASGGWVCAAAGGYLHQRMGDVAAAAAWWDRALRAMPPETFRAFTRFNGLVREDAHQDEAVVPHVDRTHRARWFWWASDPFLAADAFNDRRSERFTRLFEFMMSADLRGRIDGVAFTPSLNGRVRRPPFDSYEAGDPDRRIIGTAWTSRAAAFNHFVPEVFALDSLHPGLEYRLEARLDRFGTGSDEGYTRAEGRVYEIPAQYARFLEGDSMVVAIASRLEESGIGGTGQAFFMASPGPGDVVTLPPSPLRETVVFAGQVANRRQVVGIEVVTLGDDARSREVMEPLPEVEPLLSDLLLYRPVGSELPGTRTRAAGMMHGTSRIPGDRDLGLYWEGYGLPPDTEVEASLRLASVEGGGLFGGLGRALGFGGADETGAVSWTVTTPPEGILTHAITLDLETLDEAAYDLVLTMTTPDGTTVERTRRFEVVEGEAR